MNNGMGGNGGRISSALRTAADDNRGFNCQPSPQCGNQRSIWVFAVMDRFLATLTNPHQPSPCGIDSHLATGLRAFG